MPSIGARKIGLAVAGNSSRLAAMAGVRLPIESHVLQAMVTEPLKEFRVKWNQALVVRNLMQHFSEELDGVVYLVGADRPTSEENAYTNFLMLHRASLNGRKFIDRAQPRDSLLLQWALPRDIAKYPAPEVRGWRPYFTGLNDRRVRDFENWVRSLYSPAPIYPIDFDPEPEEEEAEATESAQAEP